MAELSYKMDDADVTIEGVMDDGRRYVVNTKGNVEIRTKKKPHEEDGFIFTKYDYISPTWDEYELVGDLKYDSATSAVFTIKVEPLRVEKKIEAPYSSNVNIESMAKRLGVPAQHKKSFRAGKTVIVFSWEEEIA